MSDPYSHEPETADRLGKAGAQITPANGVDLDPIPKAIEVVSVSAGTVLEFLPVGNADGAWLTVDAAHVGYTPKFRVRRVGENTTCTVVSIER